MAEWIKDPTKNVFVPKFEATSDQEPVLLPFLVQDGDIDIKFEYDRCGVNAYRSEDHSELNDPWELLKCTSAKAFLCVGGERFEIPIQSLIGMLEHIQLQYLKKQLESLKY